MDGPWVYGALTNNLVSFGGRSGPGGNSYNNFLLQPFVNYNFSEGWYVSTSPVIPANWQAKSGQQWIVPFGGAVGKVEKFGKLPVNFSLGAYYNAVRPSGLGPEWQLRARSPSCCRAFSESRYEASRRVISWSPYERYLKTEVVDSDNKPGTHAHSIIRESRQCHPYPVPSGTNPTDGTPRMSRKAAEYLGLERTPPSDFHH